MVENARERLDFTACGGGDLQKHYCLKKASNSSNEHENPEHEEEQQDGVDEPVLALHRICGPKVGQATLLGRPPPPIIAR